MAAPLASTGQEILAGPDRHGSERVWRVRLADGTQAVLGELLPELAREESLRRRYVRDAERLAALDAPSVPRTLALGPEPDPRDPKATPPWRLRVEPPGRTLEAILAERAPLARDEATALAARLCDALAEVHARGAVLRDLQPRQIVLDGERLWLADVGLARVDLLSTRTASSLILEGSPYASPEHLRTTRVDARSDLYTVGVILWRALTGALPFGDGPALLKRGVLPAIDAPAELQTLLARLLADKAEARPDSAREVAAALRGEPTPGRALARIACQGCGASLPTGLRLCLACGKTAVQLVHVEAGAEGRALDLVKLRDEARYLGPLRETLEAVARPPFPRLDFLVGDARYYAKEEKESLIKLPARLLAHLEPETAARLKERLAKHDIQVEVRDPAKDRRRKRRGAWTMLTSPIWFVAAALVNPVLALPGIVQLLVGFIDNRAPRSPTLPPILQLRDGPAALPAAEPLLTRLSGLAAAEALEPDVREQVASIALCVQGLDARQLAYAPIERLVDLVEKQVRALAALDRELATLDEGAIVRALAASEARREPRSAREPLLAGLDRLRSLEDLRAAAMQRLLEASTLLRRATAVAKSAEPLEEAVAMLEEP